MKTLRRINLYLNVLFRAIVELLALRKEATHTERTTLITYIDSLDGMDPDRCIYGLLTGYCYNQRALHLVKACAVPPFVKKLFIWSGELATLNEVEWVRSVEKAAWMVNRYNTPLEYLLLSNFKLTKFLSFLILKPKKMTKKDLAILLMMWTPALFVLTYSIWNS